jgi:membrane-bound inhibitor of C-type lysozyme
MKRIQLGAAVLPLLLAVPFPAQAQSRMVNYQCEAGGSFQIEYSGDAARLMRSSDDSVTLPSVVSASGARYSNGEITLFTKGNQAFIEENGQQTHRNCVGEEISASESTAQTVIYECSDGSSFSVRYLAESADLMLNGRNLTLPQVRSGSGIRYSDGDTILSSKGNEASVEMNGTIIYQNCLAQTAATQTPAQPTTQPVRGMW